MGTYDTASGHPRHDPAADEDPFISPDEDALLGVLEDFDAAQAAIKRVLPALIMKIAAAMYPVGSLVHLGSDSDRGRGHPRGATHGRVLKISCANIDWANPEMTKAALYVQPVLASGKDANTDPLTRYIHVCGIENLLFLSDTALLPRDCLCERLNGLAVAASWEGS